MSDNTDTINKPFSVWTKEIWLNQIVESLNIGESKKTSKVTVMLYS